MYNSYIIFLWDFYLQDFQMYKHLISIYNMQGKKLSVNIYASEKKKWSTFHKLDSSLICFELLKGKRPSKKPCSLLHGKIQVSPENRSQYYLLIQNELGSSHRSHLWVACCNLQKLAILFVQCLMMKCLPCAGIKDAPVGLKLYFNKKNVWILKLLRLL